MTHEQINAAIEHHVFGITRDESTDEYAEPKHNYLYEWWLVLEAIREKLPIALMASSRGATATVWLPEGKISVSCKTPAEAVCLISLRAFGVEAELGPTETAELLV